MTVFVFFMTIKGKPHLTGIANYISIKTPFGEEEPNYTFDDGSSLVLVDILLRFTIAFEIEEWLNNNNMN